jgi:tungstate transport system ATP-binding protein
MVAAEDGVMHGMASPLPLAARGLGFRAGGVAILSGVSFELAEGAPCCIVGPNGAGKSVLLRLLHGLLRPTEGVVSWAGPARQAMVFQRPVMLRRSVADNIAHALALQGVPAPDRPARVGAALEAVGLLDLADRPARRLSGGEQQRVALARAIALRPQVLFLDEPTASLDPAATRAVEEIVARVAAAGCKVVMTTHDLHQARRLAGEVLMLHRGRVAEHAPAAEFFNTPRSAEAQAFLRGEILE